MAYDNKTITGSVLDAQLRAAEPRKGY